MMTGSNQQNFKNSPPSAELSGTELCRPGGKGLVGRRLWAPPDGTRGEAVGRVTFSVR